VDYLALWAPGPLEIVVIAIVALLLFGRRLPEVGKNLGRGIVEFKRGLREAEDEVRKPIEEAGKNPSEPPAPPSRN
jgi:sec-independent protein translocase protein TatA